MLHKNTGAQRGANMSIGNWSNINLETARYTGCDFGSPIYHMQSIYQSSQIDVHETRVTDGWVPVTLQPTGNKTSNPLLLAYIL